MDRLKNIDWKQMGHRSLIVMAWIGALWLWVLQYMTFVFIVYVYAIWKVMVWGFKAFGVFALLIFLPVIGWIILAIILVRRKPPKVIVVSGDEETTVTMAREAKPSFDWARFYKPWLYPQLMAFTRTWEPEVK